MYKLKLYEKISSFLRQIVSKSVPFSFFLTKNVFFWKILEWFLPVQCNYFQNPAPNVFVAEVARLGKNYIYF